MQRIIITWSSIGLVVVAMAGIVERPSVADPYPINPADVDAMTALCALCRVVPVALNCRLPQDGPDPSRGAAALNTSQRGKWCYAPYTAAAHPRSSQTEAPL